MLALLAALLLPAGLSASPAHAQAQAPEELGLEVEIGFDGQSVQNRWTPVTVTLAPTRLIAGELGVFASTDQGSIVDARDIEVSAGSTKVFRFLVPPSHDLTVQLIETGTEGVTIRPQRQQAQGFLIGVLGEDLPSSLPPATSYPLDERGTFVTVAPDWLDRSSRSLDSLSGLVVTPEQLDGLSEDARRSLTAAVSSGTDLIVPATAPGPIDLGLRWEAALRATATTVTAPSGATAPVRELEPGPLAWPVTVGVLRADDEPASSDDVVVAATVNAGRGRVTVTGVGLGEGELGNDGTFWSHVLRSNVVSRNTIESEGGNGLGQVAGEGLRSDSFSLPPIPLIVAFLVAYLLMIGPINGLVLSRLGRREMAWVTIPAMTLVFSGGAFLTASGTESGIGMSGRAAYWIDGTGTEVAAVALRAPRPGEHTLTMPGTGWDVTPGTWTNIPARIDRSGSDTIVRTDLEALQVGTAIGLRDIDVDAPMSLDLDPIPDGVRATVTNRTSGSLSGVALRAGTVSVALGEIGPGETATGEILDARLPIVRDWHDRFAGLRQPDGTVSAPTSLEALLRSSVLDGNPGIVWATATTDGPAGLSLPRADGSATDDRGSFLAVGVTPGSLGSDVLPWEADRHFVTTGFGNGWRPGPLAVQGRLEAVLRFRFPHEGTPVALTSSLERGELQGQFDLDVGRVPDVEVACDPAEIRDAEGNLLRVQEVCAPVDPQTGKPMSPDQLDLPPCPPDASDCRFEQGSFTFCFDNGVCEGGEVAVPRFDRRGSGLEIFDFSSGGWRPLVDSYEAGTDDTLSTAFLSPTGEAYVRVIGELQPFDYSGRGLSIVNGEA